MPRNLALFISYLFHPVFVPLYAMYIFFSSGNYQSSNQSSYELIKFMTIFAFLLTVLMPLISLIILVRNKFVSSYHLEIQKERTSPFLITAFYYSLFYILLKKLPPSVASWEFYSMILGAIIVLVLVTLVNIKIKVSAHAAGYAGIVGIYMGLVSTESIMLNHQALTLLIVLVGVIGSARLSLNAHQPREIYLGAVIGFLAEFLIVKNQFVI